jgi:hypothetical protein
MLLWKLSGCFRSQVVSMLFFSRLSIRLLGGMIVLSADYYLPSYGGECFSGSGKRSSKGDASVRRLSLEDEIRILRTKMEQLFLQEKSFTSDNVIEISSMLDLKINEYMKVRPRRN